MLATVPSSSPLLMSTPPTERDEKDEQEAMRTVGKGKGLGLGLGLAGVCGWMWLSSVAEVPEEPG